MISTRAFISISSSPCIIPLETVMSAPITIGIPVFFMLDSFLEQSRGTFSSKVVVLSRAKSRYFLEQSRGTFSSNVVVLSQAKSR